YTTLFRSQDQALDDQAEVLPGGKEYLAISVADEFPHVQTLFTLARPSVRGGSEPPSWFPTVTGARWIPWKWRTPAAFRYPVVTWGRGLSEGGRASLRRGP